MKDKFRNKIKKYVISVLIVFITFASGVTVGNHLDYKPSVCKKYYKDDKTGVQYIVMVSKDGGIAIYPRLNSDGTLYFKKEFIYVKNELKGEINEQTNFNGNQ